MKFFVSAKNKLTKDKHDENTPYLEITGKALVHCYIVNNDYQYDSTVLYLFQINHLIN